MIFDAKNVLLGRKLLLAAIFWPKIKEKTVFLKCRNFCELFAPEDSPHIKQKEMMMQPLGNSSRAGTARLGQVDFDDITKRPNFVRSYLNFEWKAYQPFWFLTGQQPQFGIHKLLWAANTWPSLTACREAKLLTALGGRALLHSQSSSQGKGPRRPCQLTL